MKNGRNIILIVQLILLIFVFAPAEKGMYPPGMLPGLQLEKKGLNIPVTDIYNPDSVSLIDAICIVGGGCTGSFVSDRGLILTNHHCAFRAVQAASSKEHDYLHDGFIARSPDEEIIAKGYTIKITESYRDVSQEVLSVITPEMTPGERTKAIKHKTKEIEKQSEDKHPGKKARVAEMFKGKTYVLFLYTYLKDVRLVYVPPHSIGNFGGETDNWEWPRHTGDFSFLRVYTAPDGSPAEYSPDNIPYTPKKYLQVAPQGVKENDFAFILGYPGRTFRHRTASYLAYDEEVYMPYVIQTYDWAINVMENMGQNDRTVALKHASVIKGLANVSKKYKGRLRGMKRLSLTAKRKAYEKELTQFIDSRPKLQQKYGTVLSEIDSIYARQRIYAERNFILNYLKRFVRMFGYAYTVYESSTERTKPDLERKYSYMEKNYPRLVKSILNSLDDYYQPTDEIMFKEFLLRASALPDSLSIKPLASIVGGKNPEKSINKFVKKCYGKSKLYSPELLKELLNADTGKIAKMKDPFIKLALKLAPEYKKAEEENNAIQGKLDALYGKLFEIKQIFEGSDFVPDANFTLRFTYGYIKGYSPADALYAAPFTTVQGIVEKHTGNEPFNAPKKLLNLIKGKVYSNYRMENHDSVPVNMLYDMDTTGGNSGSPVIDGNGRLIGLNFDRAFEATINDYEWSTRYSRSIGVDIRYILWLLENYAEADYLLREMNVN